MKLITKVEGYEDAQKQQAQEGLNQVLDILNRHPHPSHEYALGIMTFAFEYGNLYAEDHQQLCEVFGIKLL